MRMEEVLNVYELPYNPDEPVLCIDEKPVQLLKDFRESLPTRPGLIKRIDNEYIRYGTANIFACVEPKGGKHFTYVTKNKKGKEFAKVLYRISRYYHDAKVIHLIMDNFSTHKCKSLIDFYGEKKGNEIWKRFVVHYTPKHGSWLNQAEIEISMISNQCLGKTRTGDIYNLINKVRAWNKVVNRKEVKINWRFTTKKAREKFKY